MSLSMATIHPLSAVNPAANATGGSGGTDTQAASITANDFLTLLVNELKNQDPTAQTDPNEYVNQLVQVNSLQQLIQINQNLSTALGTGAPELVRGGAAGAIASASGIPTGVDEKGSHLHAASPVPEIHKLPATSGNLGIPQPIPAAQRVAEALSGR